MGFVITLEKRIDTSNAAEVEKRITEECDNNTGAPTFDASELSYISSSGLRILMKVRKRYMSQRLKINDVSSEVYEIFSSTGFTELFDISKRPREISVDGCEVVGTGFYGTVYRLDEEKIVKVYDSRYELSMMKTEQDKARMAFVNGMPTAIPFDIVKVGDCYGSVFELFRSDTFNDIIKKQPERADEIIDRYVAFVKHIHSLRAYGVPLPTATGSFWRMLEIMKEELGDDLFTRLKQMISAMPYDDRFVHGDLQMKNIMMYEDEPMLIDMDTLSKGQPIFDLQALYVTYRAFSEDEPGNSMAFLGIPEEMAEHIWNSFLSKYLGTDDERTLRAAEDKIRLLAYIRFMFIILTSSLKDTDLGKLRIQHAKEHITELLGTVKNFEL